VFALERRIYKIDTLRLNPGGVPLRGIGYAAALIVVALVAGAMPGIGAAVAPIPWYVRDIAVPLAFAGALTVLQIDGRPAHVAARSALGHVVAKRAIAALARKRRSTRRWVPPPIVFIADGSEPRPRALRYRGPGAVQLRFPHDRVEWTRGLRRDRADIVVHPAAGRGEAPSSALELSAGTLLEISARPWRKSRAGVR
jgi:hypothetical protein